MEKILERIDQEVTRVTESLEKCIERIDSLGMTSTDIHDANEDNVEKVTLAIEAHCAAQAFDQVLPILFLLKDEFLKANDAIELSNGLDKVVDLMELKAGSTNVNLEQVVDAKDTATKIKELECKYLLDELKIFNEFFESIVFSMQERIDENIELALA